MTTTTAEDICNTLMTKIRFRTARLAKSDYYDTLIQEAETKGKVSNPYVQSSLLTEDWNEMDVLEKVKWLTSTRQYEKNTVEEMKTLLYNFLFDGDESFVPQFNDGYKDLLPASLSV